MTASNSGVGALSKRCNRSLLSDEATPSLVHFEVSADVTFADQRATGAHEIEALKHASNSCVAAGVRVEPPAHTSESGSQLDCFESVGSDVQQDLATLFHDVIQR